jgi:hypothetical protein
MNKEEIKKFINDAFADELENRNRVLNAWYKPQGAPGRLSEELLEMWHRKNETGITHPSDILGHCVSVKYDPAPSEICKCFAARWDAINFRDKMSAAGLSAVYLNPYTKEQDDGK